LRLKLLLPTVMVSVLVGIFLLGSPCSGGIPIPPPPYIPKCPEEDILAVTAYIEQGTPNLLHLTLTFAAATPATGQVLFIIVTRLQGSMEVVVNTYQYGGPPKTTYTLTATLLDGGNVDIALYAMVGTAATERAPDTGFLRITSLSAGAPNRFTDYESVGGVVMPTNTFMALAPYLAMIGLFATAAVAVKKRRN